MKKQVILMSLAIAGLLCCMLLLHILPYKIFLPVHHLYASRHDNVTSSIQDTVCLELEKCNKTASSYEDSIYQNLFRTLRSAAQKDIPIISFRILRDHFLHML